MKNLKKLTLKKEIVARMTDNQMSHLWGGAYDGNYYAPVDNTYVAPYPTPPLPQPSTNINDCPDYSKAGSGCPAETCGWAKTCNG